MTYFAIRKVTDELKVEMCKLVQEEKWEELKKLIPKSIRVGYAQNGWKFKFNFHAWHYFDDNLESMKDFYSKCEIIDDKKNVISNEELWEIVKSGEDGIDGKEYYTNWSKYHGTTPPPKYIPPSYDEEYHFGLRFYCSDYNFYNLLGY